MGLPATQAHDRSPIVVFISFGTLENELKVFPRELTLEAGELYQLVVSNPSENNHVVVAPEFAATALTKKLLKSSPRIDYPAASLTTGISVQPGHMMEWTFTPLKEGTYKFGCDEPVHAAAGMHATIKVVLIKVALSHRSTFASALHT